MVIGRVVLLFFMILVSGLLLTVERAVGVPVVFLLLSPWGLSLCRQPERVFLFSLLVIMLAVVFVLPVGVAGVCLVAVGMVRPIIALYFPSTVGAILRAISFAGILVAFALVAKVPISVSVVVYALLILTVASWLSHNKQDQMHANSAEREKIVVFS